MLASKYKSVSAVSADCSAGGQKRSGDLWRWERLWWQSAVSALALSLLQASYLRYCSLSIPVSCLSPPFQQPFNSLSPPFKLPFTSLSLPFHFPFTSLKPKVFCWLCRYYRDCSPLGGACAMPTGQPTSGHCTAVQTKPWQLFCLDWGFLSQPRKPT